MSITATTTEAAYVATVLKVLERCRAGVTLTPAQIAARIQRPPQRSSLEHLRKVCDALHLLHQGGRVEHRPIESQGITVPAFRLPLGRA